MIKKFLCLLFTLFLFAGAAHAEAFQLNVSFDADGKTMVDYLRKTMKTEADQAEQLAEGIVELIGDASITMNVQDQWVYLAIMLKDSTLLDVGISSDWDRSDVLSSLWPEYYVSMPVDPERAAEVQQASEAMLSIDWEHMGADIISVIGGWFAGRDSTTEHGNFMGDTYALGVKREKICFEDRDVAKLTDSVLDVVEANGFTDNILQTLLDEKATMLVDLRKKNSEIAENNRYSYVIYRVFSKNDELIGASMVVMENDVQVMTLSYGVAGNGVRLVWSYGLNEKNIHINLDVIDAENGGKEFALVVYEDPAKMGFRMVENVTESMRWVAMGTMAEMTDSGKNGWFADFEVIDRESDVHESRYRLEVTGEHELYPERVLFKWFISADEGASPLLTVKIDTKECEPVLWSRDGLTAIVFDEENIDQSAEKITELAQDAVQDLAIKLINLVPAKLLTLLIR